MWRLKAVGLSLLPGLVAGWTTYLICQCPRYSVGVGAVLAALSCIMLCIYYKTPEIEPEDQP